MAELHLLYVLVQSWWGRHLCWEHLNGGLDNEQSSKKSTLKGWDVSKSPAVDLCPSCERIDPSLQAGTWALLSAPGPAWAFTGCCGHLLWEPQTTLNPRQMASHQKRWHNVYVELKQVLVQYCCLTKSKLIGGLKHHVQIWAQIEILVRTAATGAGLLVLRFLQTYGVVHEQASSAEILLPVMWTYKV